ncbi:MAG: SDR family NAD(P)-dependent oxidoreductase [Bacilli bacterium]|nr:SDR family NAD(P)-dependent oxidoreductase [Bacilli bacterium]
MRVTLITGAASGLGYEFAEIYASKNNNLLLVDIDEKKLNEVVNTLKLKYEIIIESIVTDLGNKDELKKIYQYTKDHGYFVDNLVNSAGFGDRCDFLDMDIDKQMAMTDVDCNALLYFTKVFADEMAKQNEGHIINVASIAGFMSGPYMCTYHACKAYVLLLGEAISHELRKTNVKLLTLCPGPFLSDFVKKAHNDYTFQKIKPVTAKKVAEFGYKKSLKGKTMAIVGLKNRLTVFICRFFPRKMVTAVSAKNMKKE